MPVLMEQDFPRGGATGGSGEERTEFRKKKNKSQRVTDSVGGSGMSKDDLIVDKDDEDGGGSGSDDEFMGKSDELFKLPKPSKPTKKTRDRARAAAEAAGKEKDEDDHEFVVEPLTYDTIQEGLLTLGIVHEVRDHEIVVTLPGRTVGSIPLTSISAPYTNLLKKIESGGEDMAALKPLQELFTVGQVLIVRVVNINEVETHTGSVRRTISLSSDPSAIHSAYNATLLQEGMQFTAAIQSIEDHGLVMDVGIKGVRSFLPRNRLPAAQYARAGVGQLLHCKVVLAKVQRLLCNLTLQFIPSGGRPTPNVVEDESLNASLLLPGMVLDAHVMQAHKTGLKIYFMELMGTVHQDHTGQPWQLPLDLEKYSEVKATVLYIQPHVGSLPALTLRRDLCPGRHLPAERATDAAHPRGASYPVTVERFEKRGLIIKFEDGAKGIVSTRRCFGVQDRRKGKGLDTSVVGISAAFPVGSKHRCRVLEYSELDDVYVGSFAHADAPESIAPKTELLPGAVLKCSIVEWKKSGALVRLLGPSPSRVSMAFIPNLHFDKYDEIKTRKRRHPEGAQLKAKVWSSGGGKLLLTARKKFIQTQEEQQQQPVKEVGDCRVGMVLRGMVLRAGTKGLHVVVVGGVMGFVPASLLGVPAPFVERQYPLGELVEVRVKEVEPQRPTLIFSLVGEGDEEEEAIVIKKEEEEEAPEVKEERKRSAAKKKKNRKRKNSKEIEIKEEDSNPHKRAVAELRPAGAGASFWEEEDAPKKEDATEEAQAEAPPPSKRAKKAGAGGDRESEIRRQESALADPTRAPSSSDDYELLLLASPSSSLAWIKYISMHLEAGNLAEARAIGERALATIPGAEEQERFNVWTALLNLENEHGTTRSLRAQFQAALRNCDELATYKQMAGIYIASKKNDEARTLLRAMTRKFPGNVTIWSLAAQQAYKSGQCEEGRALYARAVAALPPRHHVEIISKFAQLELTFGDFEQGRALYEKLVATYGARVDIWLVYINQLIKQKDWKGARALFERVTGIGGAGAGVNPKKMQPVFKRWLEFEREHGTIESVAAVEEGAAMYYKARLGLSVLGDEGAGGTI